jgi:hypothetical protein
MKMLLINFRNAGIINVKIDIIFMENLIKKSFGVLVFCPVNRRRETKTGSDTGMHIVYKKLGGVILRL